MTFSVRQVIDDADLPPFEFEDADGEMRELPHIKTLSARDGMRMLADGDVEEVLEKVAPDVAAMIFDLPTHASDALVRAWLAHSGIDLKAGGAPGKSPSSLPSSRSTATPSKRTSRSAASRSRR